MIMIIDPRKAMKRQLSLLAPPADALDSNILRSPILVSVDRPNGYCFHNLFKTASQT